MRLFFSLFSGLRGKLVLTYTLVTVLALLALELLALLAVGLVSLLTSQDLNSYLNDVHIVLGSQARQYLQPGQEDLPGLQAWLDEVYASGYASLEPQYLYDSPAARIAPEVPLVVISPAGVVLAQSPRESEDSTGMKYRPPGFPGASELLQAALSTQSSLSERFTFTPGRNYLLAVPISAADLGSRAVGVIILAVEPPPSFLSSVWPIVRQTWPAVLAILLGTGALLLIAVAPFGALFGLIMSRPLTRRLKALAATADAWSQGDFQPMPTDRSKDEIGYLGLRMRNMAERIQGLLQSQQELAALEERNRLARDLHDTVKQQAFATLMQVRAARNLLEEDPQAARQCLEEAENLLKTSQSELGRLIAELRPAALEGQGLAGALRQYLQTWTQHTRIPAELNVQNERSLPLEVEQALFRIGQEALANVAKHSRASAAGLKLEYTPNEVELRVVDNGVGFDAGSNGGPGYGLQSMRERARALGGSVQVLSSSETGTEVCVRIPLRKEAPSGAHDTHAKR